MNILSLLRIIALFLCCCAVSSAQTYTLEVTTGTYQDLSGATDLAAKEIPESIVLDIPFAFEAFGTEYQLSTFYDFASLERAGFIFLERFDSGQIFICRAFLADLDALDSTSAVSYKLEGEDGSRLLKFQWKNMKLVGNPAGDFVNAQIWIHERTGDLEVHIGPHRVTGRVAMGNAAGPSIGMLVANSDFSDFYHWYQLAGLPEHPAIRQTPANLAGVPANGTIYRFHYDRAASVGEGKSASGISFHPNPADDLTRITLPEYFAEKTARLAVYDVMGREVLRLENISDGATIPAGSLAPGIYYSVVISGTGRHDAGRLLVR